MRTEIDTKQATIAKVWDAYQDWATYSRRSDETVTSWRRLVLSLSVLGAVLETLSGVLNPAGSEAAVGSSAAIVTWNTLNILGEDFSTIGLLGAVFLMSAAYLSKEIVGGERQEARIQARAAAEALKSEVYLYAMQAAPYDTETAEEELLKKWQSLEESMARVAAEPTPSKRSGRTLPARGMSASDYVSQRLNSQIDPEKGYYWRSVRKNNKSVRNFQWIGLCLAWLSAVLGILVAAGVGSLATWVAVVTTVSGTIAAYFQAGRYEQLSLSYAATARRLAHTLARWELRTSAGTPVREAAALAASCEAIMSAENQGWMAQWFQGEEPGKGKPIKPQSKVESEPADNDPA